MEEGIVGVIPVSAAPGRGPSRRRGHRSGRGGVGTMDLLLQDIGRVRPLRPHEQVGLARRVEEGDAGIPRDDVELLRLRGDTVRSLDGPAGSGVRRRAELVCDERARIGAEFSMSRERVRQIQSQAPAALSRQREVAGLRSAARRAPT